MAEESQDRIKTVNIEIKMKSAYLDYSMSVIISRALPDVRDGLKPVHRRVLTAMNDLNLSPGRPYRKSAKITGDTTGNYHPHGTAAVYDTLVRMAQDFSLRYPLVDGQGNFGSVDGDSPAAERYTEARLAPFAMEILRDLDKETVDFVPNYDGSREMPSVLPSAIPNLLVNGSTGIAVGMATNCPPHNLREIIDGLGALLEDPELDDIELLEFVKGPDFPTGGIIHGRQGIVDYIATGRGRIVMRARCETEELKNGREAIIVTEIPYFVNKSELIQKIAQHVRGGLIEGIADLADESDRKGMRIVIQLKKDAHREVVLNQLFKHTNMQSTFGVNNIALVGTQPRLLSLKDMMVEYLKFREEVVVRRTEFELRKAEARAHILEGYRIALENIDEVVELIKKSPDPSTARNRLMERFELSEIQAQAILDLRLQRLTGLERDKIEKEYFELIQEIERLRSILASRSMQLSIIKDELLDLREKFGDERRTEIVDVEGDLSLEDLIPEEDMVVTISHGQYVKRLPVDTYRLQGRGGRGVTGATLKDEDWVEHLFVANTHQYLLVFTSSGRCHWLKVHQIPQAGRAAKGKAIVNLLLLEKDEIVRAIVPVPGEFDEDHYVLFVTEAGLVKRTSLDQFSNIRRSGIRAIDIVEDDRLMDAALTDGTNHVILALRSGKSIRFDENDVRPMGRTARGVKGIELSSGDDRVVGMIVTDPAEEVSVLSVTENGYGKRTPLDEYRPQGRGGKGIITMNITRRNGPLVGVQLAREEESLMVITRNGIVIKMAMDSISSMGRNTQGVRLINLDEEDAVATVAPVATSSELENDEDEADES
jgi:DNA gyrase subunit A